MASSPLGEKRPVEIVVKCQCEGYGFDLTAELYIDQIAGLMKKLTSASVAPANSPYIWKDQGKDRLSNGSNDAPLCGVHGTPMRQSKKGGGWYCPRKLDNGEYCKEKVAA